MTSVNLRVCKLAYLMTEDLGGFYLKSVFKSVSIISSVT
jgi:hypothetical protein